MKNEMIRELTATEVDLVSGAQYNIGINAGFATSVSAFLDIDDFGSAIGAGYQIGGQAGITLPSLGDLIF